MRDILFVSMLLLVVVGFAWAQASFETDTFPTTAGDLQITFIGHATLMLKHGDKVIHIDPVSPYADYSTLPKADIILVTHEHSDHLDAKAIEAISKADTVMIGSPACAGQVSGMIPMKNGEVRTAKGVRVEAVPAYNVVNKRPDGQPFHPKGQGNGYVLTLADKRVYVAGDTENIPEMKSLQKIDVAFLPMNLPYTMTPEMVVAAAKSFLPKILYPYHTGNTDTSKVTALLAGTGIDVRIRNLK